MTNHAGHSEVGRTEIQIGTESDTTTTQMTNLLDTKVVETEEVEIQEAETEGVITHLIMSVAIDQIMVHAEGTMI